MCGIAGILYKRSDGGETGRDLISMLDGCQHRGPDSTGFALYGPSHQGELVLRFFIDGGEEGKKNIEEIGKILADHGCQVVKEDTTAKIHRVRVRFDGDIQKLAYAIEEGAKVVSIGSSLEIVKDVGSAHEVDDLYQVSQFKGTHGIGHVRLATESDVKPEAAHPFWATGFADVAIVHNGQITNYWIMRRRLERRGFEFRTDNDSELISVYLADKMSQGVPLKEVLETAITDLDGTFSFLVSTPDEIGYAKDRLAAKPMVMFESDDLIAIASEEVSLNRLFPGQALDTREPPPGTFDTWSRSI